jgi:hypothetical protein
MTSEFGRFRHSSMIGRCVNLLMSLMYLMLGTRPDLAYAIGKLSRFSANPSPDHLAALDRVFAYINHTKDFCLKYTKGDGENEANFTGYVDSDHAGDETDRRSVAGYVFSLGNTAFSWYSKKQSSVATSTMEAELVAIFQGAQQCAWIRLFFEQIGFPLEGPLTIFSDSQSAIAVATGQQTHQRSKHIEVKFYSVRERVDRKQISLEYVPSKDNVADIFTKSLPKSLFDPHTEALGFDLLETVLPPPPAPKGDTSASQ